MSAQVEQQSAPGFKDPNQTLSGPIIGIIYPPPEVRNIVDKTANFVARNGPEFESRIQQSEKGNKKFGFLNSGDPYHLYYQFKVREFRDGNVKDFAILPGLQKLSVSTAAQQKQQELLKQATEAQFVPKEPPPEFEFVADPPSISALDLDVVKLTAQFVARNGRQFLTNLMNREQRNFQFDFLRPQHALFQYFTKLLEQYTKILIPPKELVPKLKQECEADRDGINQILDQVKYRANWQKHQDAARRREEEMVERERVAYAQIDWHDFVVVEVVDYQPYENGSFPAPTTPDEVGARVLMEQRLQEDDNDIEMQIESDEEIDQQVPHSNVKMSVMESRIRDNNQVQDMDEANSDEESGKQPTVTPLMPPTHDKVVVKKYDPKQAQKIVKPSPISEDYLISPLTGEKIPASKVAEHMRIGLLDPRWVEQREQHIEKVREDTVYAPGSAIEASLKQLAERRTDIFGVGDEEAAIGKKLGEEEPKKDDRVTWDGHTSSVEAATRAAARNISLEDQIHQIHKQKGLLPDDEKEKIGPKQAAISAPPKPPSGPIHPPINLPSQIAHHSAPPMHSAPPVNVMMNPMMNQMRQQPPTGPPPMRPPPMMPPPGFPAFHPGMPLAPAPPVNMGMGNPDMGMNDDEPASKRPRQEDHLIPEDIFMQSHKSPVTIQVQCPTVTDKPEWKLSGQMLSITIALPDTIQKLKQRVQEETDMPPAKQKISHDGVFFKDNNTVAYYNLVSGSTIHLQVKERGGRKK